MLEILGYMVVAYGVARLLQTSKIFVTDGSLQLVGAFGIAALILLGILLQQQASSIGSLVP